MIDNLKLPLDSIEVMDDELLFVLGGAADPASGASANGGCECLNGMGCGCGCTGGKDCGCNCYNGRGCGCAGGQNCGCECSATPPPSTGN